jgi:hypothetical protein
MNRILTASWCVGASRTRLLSPALRPSPLAVALLQLRRPISTVGVDKTDKTGFIDTTPEESLLYFDSQ